MSFVTLTITCGGEKREFLLADLSLFPFSAFEETETGLLASCDEEEWTGEDEIVRIIERYKVPYLIDRVEKINWNEEWEKNYDPVIVEEQCIVRASFHEPRPEFPYEILITPKMSFGTGHHATTYQILKYQIELDHKNKKVLDVGCGTGALAIMAHKKGATNITAIDIDDWCVENSQENFALNNCEGIELKLGGIELVNEKEIFDIILANINKNVLLQQITDYAKCMKPEAILVLSGFYTEDIPDLLKVAEASGLGYMTRSRKDKWAMLVLKKN